MASVRLADTDAGSITFSHVILGPNLRLCTCEMGLITEGGCDCWGYWLYRLSPSPSLSLFPSGVIQRKSLSSTAQWGALEELSLGSDKPCSYWRPTALRVGFLCHQAGGRHWVSGEAQNCFLKSKDLVASQNSEGTGRKKLFTSGDL